MQDLLKISHVFATCLVACVHFVACLAISVGVASADCPLGKACWQLPCALNEVCDGCARVSVCMFHMFVVFHLVGWPLSVCWQVGLFGLFGWFGLVWFGSVRLAGCLAARRCLATIPKTLCRWWLRSSSAKSREVVSWRKYSCKKVLFKVVPGWNLQRKCMACDAAAMLTTFLPPAGVWLQLALCTAQIRSIGRHGFGR